MTWRILYHHLVEEDLESIGPSAAPFTLDHGKSGDVIILDGSELNV